jgi:hypothetical protein
VVQGTSYASIVPAAARRRLPWSHYLSRPGLVESIGKCDYRQVAEGFLAESPTAGQLDLCSIGERALDQVQRRPDLDRRTAVRAARTRLRFVITPTDVSPTISFGMDDDPVRRVRVAQLGLPIEALVEWCEDVARHDWLLSTLVDVIERSRIGLAPRKDVVAQLKPALEHLVHLWMPAAHVHQELADLWDIVQQRPGLSRQWEVTVNRIRDQIALSLLESVPTS